MNKILVFVVLLSLFIGCKSTCEYTPRDPSVIESSDTYVPWWAK